jgi:hypothetical protein
LKKGLEPIDDRRPMLIHGSALKAFLADRLRKRRRTCAPGEFYCFRCRTPRLAWGGMADVRPHTEKLVRVTALCAGCETPMNRVVRRTDLPALASLIDLRTLASDRLNDRCDPIPNSVFAET